MDGAQLSGAKLERANLRGASLFQANLSDADLTEADVTYKQLMQASSLHEVTDSKYPQRATLHINIADGDSSAGTTPSNG